MKNVSGYTDKFLSEKRGLFSEGNKEKISAAVEDFKNLPEVKAQLENLNVLTQVYGAQNTMVKKITESYENQIKKLENSGNNTPQTTTMVHKHEFGSIPGYVDVIGRSILKNPTTINEWADKSVNDYTTQKIATKK